MLHMPILTGTQETMHSHYKVTVSYLYIVQQESMARLLIFTATQSLARTCLAIDMSRYTVMITIGDFTLANHLELSCYVKPYTCRCNHSFV